MEKKASFKSDLLKDFEDYIYQKDLNFYSEQNKENLEKMKNETEKWLTDSLYKGEKTIKNPIKRLVSQNKFRFIFDDFDLDLSYITKRIIAMGIPSSSFDILFRNDVSDVQRFFQIRHAGFHCVYNLCQEKEFRDHLFFRQMRFPFRDHEAPPINLIIPFCKDCKEFLDKNEKNVVAIHCKAGKGRTGTFICCLMLYLGIFSSALDSLRYYGLMRVKNGRGVTVPSQMRYVYYFEYLLKNKIQYPLDCPTKILLKVKMITVPDFALFGASCCPTLNIENQNKDNVNIYKHEDKHKKEIIPSTCPFIEFMIGEEGMEVKGDIRFEFVHFPQFGGKKTMCKFWINTYFLPKEGKVVMRKELIDKACKDKACKHFSKDFKIEVYYK